MQTRTSYSSVDVFSSVLLPQCINCAACSHFAPDTFERGNGAHHVYQQPSTHEQILNARAALSACPVAAIRVETLAERRHGSAHPEEITNAWTEKDDELVKQMSINPKVNGLDRPFPKQFYGMDEVYWLGHHNEASFGATPYLLRAQHDGSTKHVMIDTPRYSNRAVEDVRSLTGPDGPDYLFLTHVDDTADHIKWVEEFPHLRRIFHAGDLGHHNWLKDWTLEKVEVLLDDSIKTTSEKLAAFSLDGTSLGLDWNLNRIDSDVVILHTPGHSPGSISLYKKPTKSNPHGILFTGDTYAYSTRNGGQMSGFPMYGNNLRQQSETLPQLLDLDWDFVAPGHGHSRDYRGRQDERAGEMQGALDELLSRTR